MASIRSVQEASALAHRLHAAVSSAYDHWCHAMPCPDRDTGLDWRPLSEAEEDWDQREPTAPFFDGHVYFHLGHFCLHASRFPDDLSELAARLAGPLDTEDKTSDAYGSVYGLAMSAMSDVRGHWYPCASAILTFRWDVDYALKSRFDEALFEQPGSERLPSLPSSWLPSSQQVLALGVDEKPSASRVDEVRTALRNVRGVCEGLAHEAAADLALTEVLMANAAMQIEQLAGMDARGATWDDLGALHHLLRDLEMTMAEVALRSLRAQAELIPFMVALEVADETPEMS